MKGIYLGAYEAYHPNWNIVYQDINGKRDLDGDMMEIDLRPYDFVIATPPCNYYSRAAGNRHSEYAINTAHLLPDIIKKLHNLRKTFIVENVRNEKKFKELGLFNYNDIWVYRIGRHTIWSSIPFYHWLPFDYQFTSLDPRWPGRCVDLGKRKDRQGSENVHIIIESWLKELQIYNHLN